MIFKIFFKFHSFKTKIHFLFRAYEHQHSFVFAEKKKKTNKKNCLTVLFRTFGGAIWDERKPGLS